MTTYKITSILLKKRPTTNTLWALCSLTKSETSLDAVVTCNFWGRMKCSLTIMFSQTENHYQNSTVNERSDAWPNDVPITLQL